jgi:uncharacterized membrane protein
MKDMQKLLVAIACAAIACGLVWAVWYGPEQSPVTMLFFGLGLAVLASVARRTGKREVLENNEALQVSKI